MGQSRVVWAIGAVAPWCLGAGLAVSFPADAGHDALIGGSITPITHSPPAFPQTLIHSAGLLIPQSGLVPAEVRSGKGHWDFLHRARLTTGNEQDRFRPVPDETEPRIKLKGKPTKFPEADRSRKGDPFIGLRPTFDAKLRGGGGFRRYATELHMFSRDVLAFDGFQRNMTDAPADEDPAGPGSREGKSVTPSNRNAATLTSNSTVALVSVTTPRDLDGSSPRVPRAIALSSGTPMLAGMRVRVVSGPMLLDGVTKAQNEARAKIARAKQNQTYAAILVSARKPRQRKCLAQAVYFEARSEFAAGQAAVAQVVLNRVKSRLYPSSVCGVVFQNHRRYKACQFTFTCEGKSLAIRDRRSWAQAVRIADAVLGGQTYLAKVGPSTHYHATYVRPRWAKRLKRMKKIGTHIFYKLRPGQT